MHSIHLWIYYSLNMDDIMEIFPLLSAHIPPALLHSLISSLFVQGVKEQFIPHVDRC